MKKTKLAIAVAISLGALVGCGGSGGGGDNTVGGSDAPFIPTTYAELDVSAVKGTLAFADVTVTALGDTTVIGTGETDASGQVTGLQLTSEPGYNFYGIYTITVTANASSTMICDAEACGDMLLSQDVSGDALVGTQLTTVGWIYQELGADADSSAEASFQTNVLTTLATPVFEYYYENKPDDLDPDFDQEQEFAALQVIASGRLLTILGYDTEEEINLFTETLASAEMAANLDGASDLVVQLSLINAAFASFTEGETQASALAADLANVVLANESNDLDAAKELRTVITDALDASTVVTDLEVDTSEWIDFDLSVSGAGSLTQVAHTRSSKVNTATITARTESDPAINAFDGDINTSWTDNGGDVRGDGDTSETGPSWIEIDFVDAISVSVLALTSNHSDGKDGRDPVDFNLQGSNDGGTTWTTLGSWVNIDFATRQLRQEFALTDTRIYSSFRFETTEVGSSSKVMVGEIELIGAVYPEVDHSDAGGTITARTESDPASNAFDNSIDTSWTDNGGDVRGDGDTSETGPSWIEIELADAVSVTTLALTSNHSDGKDGRDPVDFNLQGSNDGGSTWATLGSWVNIDFATRQLRQEFAVTDTGFYSAFRIETTEVGSSSKVMIGEIELMGPSNPDVDHSDAGGTITARTESDPAIYAFDNSTETSWTDNGGDVRGDGDTSETGPSWIEIELANAVSVSTLGLTSNHSDGKDGRDPVDFNLQGSNDSGTTWTTLGSWVNIDFATRQLRQLFDVSDNRLYNSFRFETTEVGSSSKVMVGEIELIGATYPDVDHTDAGGTITARTESDPASNAFDNDTATAWTDNGGDVRGDGDVTNGPSWIQIELADSVLVTTLALTSSPAEGKDGRDPVDFNLQGSNDGVTWTTLGSWVNIDFATRSQRQLFALDNVYVYQMYRFETTEVGSSSKVMVGEIELIGPELP